MQLYDLSILYSVVSTLFTFTMGYLHEEPDGQCFSDVDPIVLVLECSRDKVQVVLCFDESSISQS